ncbi:MAG TPA: DUF3857 and transglutaminase domain-containing protein [Gemmatimonadaceae bacterium]|nr:DUF3857 and transglutaminase domain-containing protein [Gemmatimonadaceae bacterium]
MRQLLLLPFLLAAAAASGAQAPRITPVGDPSVRNDTIYKLAVKPEDYSDQPFVYLLDDGVVRFESDGTGSRTYRQVVQILTPDAAERWGEQTFAYSGGSEKLTVNWVRVLKPNGEVVSAKPVHEQESLAPVALEAPVYSDERIHRVSLGGVAPGTLVDYSYTVETVKPLVPGDFFTSWSVVTGRLTRRSRLIVDVPQAMHPHIVERHLTFSKQITEAKGRRIYTWYTSDVAKPETEPLAPDSSFGETIALAAPIAWDDVAKWYAGLSDDRYKLTPEIEAKLSEVVKGASTLDDSLRAAHRWVAQDFRYVSLSLGIGGYRPHLPEQVFANRYGDCKDKATFFIALARRMGVQAYPVLLSSGGGVDRTLPSAHQFDHMIAAVERPKGYTFVDLTAELVPYGSIPPPEEGEFGLVVHPGGRGEVVTFPESPAADNRSEVHIVGTLAPTGMFAGRWTREASGAQQYALRGSMSRTTKPDSAERARTTLAIANAIFEGSTGDSLQLFDGRDLRAEPKISVVIRNGRASSNAGGTEILTLPIRNFAVPQVITSLEARGPRKYPIDLDKVWGPHTELEELELTLPAGWRAKLPANVNAQSVFGTYTAEYSQQGTELRVLRKLTGATGVQPAETMPALLEWLRAMSKDDIKYLVLEH